MEYCQRNRIHVTAFGPLGCVPIPALVGRTGLGPVEDEVVSIAPNFEETNGKSGVDVRVLEYWEVLKTLDTDSSVLADPLPC